MASSQIIQRNFACFRFQDERVHCQHSAHLILIYYYHNKNKTKYLHRLVTQRRTVQSLNRGEVAQRRLDIKIWQGCVDTARTDRKMYSFLFLCPPFHKSLDVFKICETLQLLKSACKDADLTRIPTGYMMSTSEVANRHESRSIAVWSPAAPRGWNVDPGSRRLNMCLTLRGQKGMIPCLRLKQFRHHQLEETSGHGTEARRVPGVSRSTCAFHCRLAGISRVGRSCHFVGTYLGGGFILRRSHAPSFLLGIEKSGSPALAYDGPVQC